GSPSANASAERPRVSSPPPDLASLCFLASSIIIPILRKGGTSTPQGCSQSVGPGRKLCPSPPPCSRSIGPPAYYYNSIRKLARGALIPNFSISGGLERLTFCYRYG